MDAVKTGVPLAITILIGIATGGGFFSHLLDSAYNVHASDRSDVQSIEVSGFLTAAAGLPAGGHSVMLRSNVRNTRYVTTSLPSGKFVLKEVLPADDYRLDVTPTAMLQRYSRQTLHIAADSAPLRITLNALETSSLTGEVVNRNNIPAADFRIKITSKARSRWERHVTTDSAGKFKIDEVPVGEIMITSMLNRVLQADGYRVASGGEQSIRLVVDAGNQEAGGVVLDQYDEPIPGATVILSWEVSAGDARSTGYHRTFSHPDGRFKFSNIGPGEHELIVAASSGAAIRRVVDIRGDYTDLDVVLEQEPLD